MVVAFRVKQTRSCCFYTTLSCQVFSTAPPLAPFSLPGAVLVPLNRSLSFFPHEKALFISYLFVCQFFCSRLEKLAVPEGGGGGGNKQQCRRA